MSHITRRMNIVNNLMTNKEFLEEVKGNTIKLNEFLEDFKILHTSYIEMLDEDARNEDHEKWYQSRHMQITALLANITKWITAIENQGSLSLAEVSSSVTQVEESQEFSLMEEVENTNANSNLID